jgi:hypothetical protein
MKALNNLIIAIVFFGLALFEVIVFTEILNHPYMVGLLLFLCCVGGFHSGIYLYKILNKYKEKIL